MKSQHNNVKAYGAVAVAAVLLIGVSNRLIEVGVTPQQAGQNLITEAGDGLQAIGEWWQSWFDGGSDSVAARAVGAAEGTRHHDGGYNPAYWGHDDPCVIAGTCPGRGTNMGSFSYDGAATPQEADEVYLSVLEGQAEKITQRATAAGLTLTEAELLNAIDLANQAPAAALATDGGDFVNHLADAKQQGLQGWEAILYARVESFKVQATGQYAAPVFDNDRARLEADQLRRLKAIERTQR